MATPVAVAVVMERLSYAEPVKVRVARSAVMMMMSRTKTLNCPAKQVRVTATLGGGYSSKGSGGECPACPCGNVS